MAKDSAGRRIFMAAESFTTTLDGVPTVVIADVTRVREGHPLLAGREHMFRELDVHYDVEDASDAPGSKRGA